MGRPDRIRDLSHAEKGCVIWGAPLPLQHERDHRNLDPGPHPLSRGGEDRQGESPRREARPRAPNSRSARGLPRRRRRILRAPNPKSAVSGPRSRATVLWGTSYTWDTGDVIFHAPLEAMPDGIRESCRDGAGYPRCEHCNTRRKRNETWILRKEDTGEFLQVARTCVTTFFRTISVAPLTWWLEVPTRLTRGLSEIRPPPTPIIFAACTFAQIADHGWVSGKDARNWDCASTADCVANTLAIDDYKPSPESMEYAMAAVEWIRALDTEDNRILRKLKGGLQ